jgi:hypothetical protein
MKRALTVVAMAALFVAGSAIAEEVVAQDGGGTIGSGTRQQAGGLIGSGTRTMDSDGGQTVGSGGRTMSGGYFGSGLSAQEYRLFDGAQFLRVVVVSSAEGTFVVAMPE